MAMRRFLHYFAESKFATRTILVAFFAGIVGGVSLASALKSLFGLPQDSTIAMVLSVGVPCATGVVAGLSFAFWFALLSHGSSDEPIPHRALACDSCGAVTKHGWCDQCQQWIDTEEFDEAETKYCERCRLPTLAGWCDRCGVWSESADPKSST